MPPAHPSVAHAAASAKRRIPFALLAETRRVDVLARALLKLRVVRVQAHGAVDEELLFFGVLRVRQTALDRAHRLTRLVIVEADALGAELGIDHVDFVALADRFVRALGLA